MKKVGAFLLRAESDVASNVFTQVKELFNKWLSFKGEVRGDKLFYRDGRECPLVQEKIEDEGKFLYEIKLQEEIKDGYFYTHLSAGLKDNIVEVECQLYVSSKLGLVTPFVFEARAPKIIRDIVSMKCDWHAGNTLLCNKELNVNKTQAGDVARIIKSENRNLPFILISTYNDIPLYPYLASDLARDVCGLANVLLINDSVSWELTKILGKPWSCFGGAIKLYWPISNLKDSLQHPLWLQTKLLEKYPDPKEASYELRKRIREELFSIGSVAIQPSDLISEIKEKFQKKRRDALFKEAKDAGEYRQLLELQDKEIEDLTKRNRDVLDEKKLLEKELYNLRLRLAYTSSSNPPNDLDAEVETPPSNVQEALQVASKKWSDYLIFSDNIEDGIESLDPEAGPPTKVLMCLEKVAVASKELQKGSLGTDLGTWFLQNHNIKSSGESDTTVNDKKKFRQRVFPINGNRLQFNEHIKVNEGLAPTKCVRIYYQWSKEEKKMLIGRVGKHLD